MNTKELITANALLLRHEAFPDNRLILVTGAGVMTGIPVFACDGYVSKEEETVAKTVEKITDANTNPDTLRGDDSVFMLRIVNIKRAHRQIAIPFLFLRYDSVIACTIGSL